MSGGEYGGLYGFEAPFDTVTIDEILYLQLFSAIAHIISFTDSNFDTDLIIFGQMACALETGAIIDVILFITARTSVLV